jgi:hypothetical protein
VTLVCERRARVLSATVVKAAAVAIGLEHVMRESHEQIAADEGRRSTWPHACCTDASADLYDELNECVPEAYAELVWGEWVYEPGELAPWWALWRGPPWRRYEGHTWVALGESLLPPILDMTLGQFVGGDAFGLVLPGDPLYERYVERERC